MNICVVCHFLTIVNIAAVNPPVKVLCGHVFHFFWVYISKSGISRSYSSSMFNLLRNLPDCLPKWLHHFTFPPAICKSSSFSTSLLTLIFWFFDYSHPSGYEMISHMVLICISLMTNDVEHIFRCLLAICISSLEKYIFRYFTIFKLSCLSYCWVCFFFFF